MRIVISVILLTMYWASLYLNQVSLSMYDQAIQLGKGAMQIAAHDASLELSTNSVGIGQVVFNQSAAQQVFLRTFDLNAGFDPTTNGALASSRFIGQSKLVLSAFVDNSNATFPIDYTNSTYGINKVLTAPAVIFVVQVQTQSYESNLPSKTFDFPVVYQHQNV